MYVFNVVTGKGTDTYKLNMKKLLKNNEVLSFGFDDFNTEFGCICVQAKNLNLYLIDFFNSVLIQKIESQGLTATTQLNMRGIFYNYKKTDRIHKMSQEVKEFICDQEDLGNKILMPKLNKDMIVI